MTFYLQSPAGDVAIFQTIGGNDMSFVIGNDVVELTIPNARKVWRALLLCQWQRIDDDALMIYRGA